MGIIDVLPLLDGWDYAAIDLDHIIYLKKGESKTISSVVYPGWLYAIQVCVRGNPTISIKWYSRRKKKYVGVTMVPSDLLNLGYDSENDSGPYISNYDPYNEIYTVAFTPATPLPFFASQSYPKKVVIEATESDVEILNASQVAFVVYDKKAFTESIKELYANSIIKVI